MGNSAKIRGPHCELTCTAIWQKKSACTVTHVPDVRRHLPSMFVVVEYWRCDRGPERARGKDVRSGVNPDTDDNSREPRRRRRLGGGRGGFLF